MYTAKVRTYAKEMPLNEAVERAIEECIRDDILAEFLRTNKVEAMSVSIYEYDEEKTMRQLKEEYLEEGEKSGLQSGIYAFIEGFAEEGFSEERIIEKLVSKFSLTREQAETYYKNYSNK